MAKYDNMVVCPDCLAVQERNDYDQNICPYCGEEMVKITLRYRIRLALARLDHMGTSIVIPLIVVAALVGALFYFVVLKPNHYEGPHITHYVNYSSSNGE